MLPESRFRLRRKLGYKIYEIAEMLGCSNGTVSNMETGHGRVSDDLIKRYEELLRGLERKAVKE